MSKNSPVALRTPRAAMGETARTRTEMLSGSRSARTTQLERRSACMPARLQAAPSAAEPRDAPLQRPDRLLAPGVSA